MRDDFSHLDSTLKCSIANVNVILITTWAGQVGNVGNGGDTHLLCQPLVDRNFANALSGKPRKKIIIWFAVALVNCSEKGLQNAIQKTFIVTKRQKDAGISV